MTATERLRAMLDERGVEHEDRDDWGTWWSYNGTEACYVMSHGGIFFLNAKSVTPEQAIEATLGKGECEQEEHGWSTEGDHARVWLTCGHDCMVETVADLPNYCPSCGRKVMA